LKLDHPSAGYDVDVEAFYQNIDDCAAAGGATNTNALPLVDVFPQSFLVCQPSRVRV
jgi:hypothetical protein